MTDPGLRDLVIAEGRKQARIHGVVPLFADVFAEGWRAAMEAAQPAVEERERELSLARRELSTARVEVSNAHYWRDTARKDRDVAQRELAGLKERIKIRDETIRDLREDIANAKQIMRDCAHDSDGMCGYGQRALAALDGEGERPRATGGFVESGQVYQVGESGPAPFVVPPGEHFVLSREEWTEAAQARLAELGCTYAELAQMARDWDYPTIEHRKLWVLIGGTLDEGKADG